MVTYNNIGMSELVANLHKKNPATAPGFCGLQPYIAATQCISVPTSIDAAE